MFQLSCLFQLLGVFSILGTIFYGYFFSFHLLHIAEFNQLLHRTIRAITQNGTLNLVDTSYNPLSQWDTVTRQSMDRSLSPPAAVSKFGQLCSPHFACFFRKRHLKVVGPFYLVSMPGEVKDPMQGNGKYLL